MKFIKFSKDNLPKKDGMYVTRSFEDKYRCVPGCCYLEFKDGGFQVEHNDYHDLEWLDETEDWISVDDQRKPEAEEEVLIYCKGINKAMYFKDANVFYFSNTGGLANINFVTHWMPLPSPPTKQP